MDQRNTEASAADTASFENLTLVVHPNHILDAIRRNVRDEDRRRRHLLRFNRPLEGSVEGSIHVSQEGNYWPNPETAPLTLHPKQFISDDASSTVSYPNQWEVEESAKEVDDVDNLAEVSDETLDESWEISLEIWRNAVRNNLVDEVDINKYGYGSDGPKVTVEYVDESE